jgi:uncharacterized membrane protein
VVLLSGWALFPLLHLALPRLPDRGYAAAKCLGLFFSARVASFLVDWTGRPLDGGLAFAALLLVAILAVGARATLLGARGDLEGKESLAAFLRTSSTTVASVEALTLGGILLFGWIGSHHGAVDPRSERFMDYALLNASLRARHLPVADPWFAGEPLHYYHFGYAAAAFLVRAALSRPEHSLVAVIAVFQALLWAGAFGAGLGLARRRRGGFEAALLVLGAGNLEWIRQAAHGAGFSGFDWFASSRVVRGAISEFPWFTALWGDLHPYMISLPLLLAALALVIGEASAPANGPGREAAASRTSIGRGAGESVRVALFSLAAGALLATHPWDFPFLILGGMLLIACGAGRRRIFRSVAWGASGSIGGAAFLPYLIHLGQAGRTLMAARERSDPRELAMAFGPFLILAALAVAVRLAGRHDPKAGPRGVPFGTPVMAWRLALALALLGALAAGLPEVVYLRDFFSGTDLARMNTVFKLHRIAWAFLGVAAPVLSIGPIAQDLRAPGPVRRAVIGSGLALAISFSFAYPVVGTASWLRWRRSVGAAEEARSQTTVPGAAATGAEGLFRSLLPGDAAAAAWLGARAKPDDVVLEETGDAYTWSGRISTFTGIQTILGWGNHEAGWRDDWEPILARRKEVDTIYLAPDSDRARALIRERKIAWIVVGERERDRYGEGVAGRVSAVAAKRFEESGTSIYRVGGGP